MNTSALLTDQYQLTMLEAYFDEKMTDTAVFELFVRRLPPQRPFLIAAGLEQALEFLETVHFSDDELEWLSSRSGQDQMSPGFVDRLRDFRFTGDVNAVAEGTLVCETNRSYKSSPLFLRLSSSKPDS